MQRLGQLVGKIGLALAVLAYYPSIAAFTPAIMLSVLALPAALVGALCGAYRTAALTVYVMLATLLVSPLLRWPDQIIGLTLLVPGLAALGLGIAGAMVWNYRGGRRQ